VIRLSGVHKWFGSHHVLDGIDLEIAPGSRTVVCGPSGSGKSTMIRCINGLENHEDGTITVGGRRVSAASEGIEEIRRDIGMVFQSFNLFPHFTALENLTIAPMKLKGMRGRDAAEFGMDLLRRVRIERYAHKLPSQLSGGQQQRVAIARALAMQPQVMLFDEPTSALDPEMVKEVLDVMIDLAGTGMTMICVTHEMGFARAVADRVLFMCEGHIVEQSSPYEFFRAPRTGRAREFVAKVLH
jgi:general L-amino acid transport system ATP-binding protein